MPVLLSLVSIPMYFVWAVVGAGGALPLMVIGVLFLVMALVGKYK